MKKLICSLVCITLLLSCMGLFTSAEDSADCVYLATLDAIRATGYAKPSLNTNGSIPCIDGTSAKFPHSIVAHPKSTTEPSYIEYDISAYSYTHFFAYLGKNADLKANTCVQFAVHADGKEIYKSDYVYIGQEPVACIAEIPSGTKNLLLEINYGNDGIDYDNAVWGSPMLSNLQITKIEEIRHFNKTQYDIGERLAVKGGYFNVTYSNGFVRRVAVTNQMIEGFDSSAEGEKTLTISYEGFSYTTKVTIGNISPETEPPVTEPASSGTEPHTAPPTTGNAHETSSEGGKDSNTTVIIIVIAALVALFAIIFSIFYARRGKEGK